MHAGVQALLLEGVPVRSEVIQKALQAIERFTWQDEQGKRLQSCVSPVWDTVLMIRGLRDAGADGQDQRLREAVRWVKHRQQVGPEGDWRVYNPRLTPGGFSFEYHNTWYPDVDDTAAAILAMVRQDARNVESHTVVGAILWICGMQNKDGGWGAFDLDNDKQWLNKIPFSDMDSLCDPSSADCTGRILEAFGLVMCIEREGGQHVNPPVLEAMQTACLRAIQYLAHEQEPTGAWYGRWGVNYIYGTSNVLCGLGYFDRNNCDEQLCDMRNAAVSWLKQVQNDDGGWGESLLSYTDPSRYAGRGTSTPSQTAWALMGLLATCSPRDPAILAGIDHLLRTQTDSSPDGECASWPERLYTGTGFPNFFYIGYTLYRHFFPMMALGRFVALSELSLETTTPTSAPGVTDA